MICRASLGCFVLFLGPLDLSLCLLSINEFIFGPQENSKKLKMKFPTKIPNRKTKTKTGKGGITPSSLNESIEILKLDSSLAEGKGNISSPQFQAFTLQKAAAGTLAPRASSGRAMCGVFLFSFSSMKKEGFFAFFFNFFF